jgi:hypothetical protein
LRHLLRRSALLLALVAVSVAALAAPAAAQDTKLEVRDADSVKSVLERHVGKRVSLVVASGPELTGTVVKVAANVVHLGELQGREFFDAVVSLDRISAVVVRTRTR